MCKRVAATMARTEIDNEQKDFVAQHLLSLRGKGRGRAIRALQGRFEKSFGFRIDQTALRRLISQQESNGSGEKPKRKKRQRIKRPPFFIKGH